MLTSSDGGKNQIIDSFLNDSSFSVIKDWLENPWYLNFNNSAIFSDNNDEITDMYFQMGIESFEKFLIKFKSLPAKRVSISKDVFIIRERINIIKEYLIREIHNQILLINLYRNFNNRFNNIHYYYFKTKLNLKINLLVKENEYCESLMVNCNLCNIYSENLYYLTKVNV